MMPSEIICIRGGYVVDPANNIEGEYDVVVKDRKIDGVVTPSEIGKVPSDALEISAQGCIVAPGLIDIHTHLRDPGLTEKEDIRTGSRAALRGGFTTICCMPNTEPVNDNSLVTTYIRSVAKEVGLVNVLPIGAVTKSLEGKELAPLVELAEAGCIAFSDDGFPIWDSSKMRIALEWAKVIGRTICCHEEDKRLSLKGSFNESYLCCVLGVRPFSPISEEVMIARDIELCRYTRARAHICHVSSARSVELIRRAKNDGIDITCEVTPHHLVLNNTAVMNYYGHAKMSPPLTRAEDVEALRQGLTDGTIDAIASDHAPHVKDRRGAVSLDDLPMGIIGIQTNIPLTLDLIRAGVVSISKAIELWTAGPASALNIDFGGLRSGEIANVTVIDRDREWRLTEELNESKSFNCPFADRILRGRAKDVIVNGRIKMLNYDIIENDSGLTDYFMSQARG